MNPLELLDGINLDDQDRPRIRDIARYTAPLILVVFVAVLILVAYTP